MSWLKKKRNKLFVGATLLAAAVAVLNSINRQEEIVENKIREQKIILQTTPSPSPKPTPSTTISELEGIKENIIEDEKNVREIILYLESLYIARIKYGKNERYDNPLRSIICLPRVKRPCDYPYFILEEENIPNFILAINNTINYYIKKIDTSNLSIDKGPIIDHNAFNTLGMLLDYIDLRLDFIDPPENSFDYDSLSKYLKQNDLLSIKIEKEGFYYDDLMEFIYNVYLGIVISAIERI